MLRKFYTTRLSVVFLYFTCFILHSDGAPSDIQLDAKAQSNHRLDSLNLLSYTFLLILTVLTIWLFKHRRVSFLHETGLAVIYGLIVGAIIRYSGSSSQVLNMQVFVTDPQYNSTLPPDTLSLHFPSNGRPKNNKTFQYVFREEIKYFFRNLGAILTYAIIGTTVSSFVVGALMYGCVQLMPARLASTFTFLDTLYFGALISATDPLTILAIFNDLNVDVNLYALVFGESVLNDAVAIVLSGIWEMKLNFRRTNIFRSIQNYGARYQSGSGGFETQAFFKAVGDFLEYLYNFLNNTYMTKFTRVRDFPLLESALFVLMSYSTFLIAEASELTGVVAVLFCGICQAHYTYNNLSDDSRIRTKQMFELLNFLAENFIFSYIGVSMFTFPKHHFDPLFILAGFVSFCCYIRGCLRGAMAFALAIRNTLSEQRQAMLTTTSLIVIITVIIQGGATMNLLNWFQIPVGIEDETEALSHQGVHSVYNSMENSSGEGPNKPMRDSDSDLCIEENDFSNNDNTRSSTNRVSLYLVHLILVL
ncbi:hypothetical protein NQ314_020752 [Rhamnusium bicolor]|uniref:Cation/H+ exchanger transmembrane domain-containing protein n=1 Tax=Rhamnusium bicolor TaxID=1586634 RepID=A0AAV8WKW2_9CUCU|nr:hypothetical protein NQ314_020752 [Rhamnusium bicolor]